MFADRSREDVLMGEGFKWQDDTYELGHQGNHEVEQTNGLDEGETQNGVGEQLATEGGVTGNAVQESSEDETDTDTSTGQTDGGRAHTQVLGNLDQGVGHLRVVGPSLLLEGRAGGGVDDARALHGLDGAGLAHACGKKTFLSTPDESYEVTRTRSRELNWVNWTSIVPREMGPMTSRGRQAMCR